MDFVFYRLLERVAGRGLQTLDPVWVLFIFSPKAATQTTRLLPPHLFWTLLLVVSCYFRRTVDNSENQLFSKPLSPFY